MEPGSRGATEQLELVPVGRGITAAAARTLGCDHAAEVRNVGWDDRQPVFRPIRRAWRVEVAHGSWLCPSPGQVVRGHHDFGDRLAAGRVRCDHAATPFQGVSPGGTYVPFMSRVIFMCGPSGSGKSTYARALESEGMARISFDEVMLRGGMSTAPLPPELHAAIEADLQDQLLELVAAGADVVLDFSIWSRQMREDWRSLLAPTGVVPETIYLATDRDTVLARVRARSGSHADDFVLTEELAARYFDHFEPPTPDEGPLTVIS